MRVLLTSTSFQDTPGIHQKMLKETGFLVDTLRGPVTEDVLLPIIAKYDAIICGDDEISHSVIKAGKSAKLKAISKYGVGLDKIDLDAAKLFKIPVTNCPGVNHVSVAEHVIALLFTFYKNIHLEFNITKSGGWKRYVGHEIFGKKIGILGLGKIGKELAIKSKSLGMKVSAFDPNIDVDFVNKSGIISVDRLEDLILDIDILSLNLPLTKNTSGIINSELLSLATKNIVIVNTSRALIINQDDLIEQLKMNRIKAYLTDVLDVEPMIENHPLLQFDNVIITPHIGSRTFESVQRQGIMAVENLINSLKI